MAVDLDNTVLSQSAQCKIQYDEMKVTHIKSAACESLVYSQPWASAGIFPGKGAKSQEGANLI